MTCAARARRRVIGSPSRCCTTDASMRRRQAMDQAPRRMGAPSAPRRFACARRAGADARHLDSVDCQLAALDAQLERIATEEPWRERVSALKTFRRVSTRTALGLIAEI